MTSLPLRTLDLLLPFSIVSLSLSLLHYCSERRMPFFPPPPPNLTFSYLTLINPRGRERESAPNLSPSFLSFVSLLSSLSSLKPLFLHPLTFSPHLCASTSLPTVFLGKLGLTWFFWAFQRREQRKFMEGFLLNLNPFRIKHLKP